MKSTSRGSRLVRIAARSPARSSTGPEVWRRFTPISRAMICASVVLPSPGGPKSKTWSSDSLRLRAASMKICSCPRVFSCPMYSSSPRGRSARSIASSCALFAAGEIRRSVSIMKADSGFRQHLERLAYAFCDAHRFVEMLDRELRFLVVVTEGEQRIGDVIVGRRRIGRERNDSDVELVLELEQQALSCLLTNPGYTRQPRTVLFAHRLPHVRDAHAGEYRKRSARADTRNFEQLSEQRALAFGRETVELMSVLPHDQMREQRDVSAGGRQLVKRAHGHIELITDALHVDENLRRMFGQKPARNAADHTSLPLRMR